MPVPQRLQHETRSRADRTATRDSMHMMSRLQIAQEPEASGNLDRKGKRKARDDSPPASPYSTGDPPAEQAQNLIHQAYQQLRRENAHIISPFEQVTEHLGELLDQIPEELMAEWIKEADPDGRLKSILQRAWKFYSTTPIYREDLAIHQPTLAHFEWFSKNVSATHGIVDNNEVESMKEAYKFIENINLVVYQERLCHMLRWLEGNSKKVERTGGKECDIAQLSLAQYTREPGMLLCYVHEHQNPDTFKELSSIHRHLWEYRKAVDHVLFVDYLDEKSKNSSIMREKFENHDLSNLVHVLNKALWDDPTKVYVIRTENVNWGYAINLGRAWQYWCSAFSDGKRTSNRGILFVLCVMLKSEDFTFEGGDTWNVEGESMSKNQVTWIAEYIKTYFPKFMRMVQLIDWRADEIFEYGYIDTDCRRNLEDELRAILDGRGGNW